MRVTVITPSIRPKGLEITQKCLQEQTFKDFEWLTEIGLGQKHDFNKAMNRMLKRAKGELIVILQDYIKIPEDGLQKFWESYQNDTNTFLTAPVGKVKTLDYDGKIKWDWRNQPEAKMNWTMWEIDWGACPKEAIYKIGGFDEELDQYWSFDNVNVGCRADLAKYKFLNVIDNKALAYDHDAFIPHPFRKDYNPDFHNERLDEFRRGKTIDFLNS